MNHKGFSILIFFLISFTSPSAWGQENYIDSLLSIYQGNSKPEDAKAALAIAKNYISSNPDTAVYYARIALTKFLEYDRPNDIATSRSLLSRYFTLKRNRTESINQYLAINELAEIYTDSLEIQSTAFETQGWHHYVFENYPEGLESYLKLISVCELLKDYDCHYRGLMNSSLIYTTMENYADADRHLKKALAMAKVKGDSMHLLIANVNLSGNYRQSKQPDSSLFHAQIAYDISRDINSQIGIVKSLNHLAVNSLDLGSFEAAMNYSDEILNSGLQDLQSLSLAHKYKAAALDSMGQFQEAFQHAELSMQAALENGDGKYILNSYEQLYLLHKESGDYDLALDYFEKHEVLKDSLFNMEKNVRINQLKEQYESEKNLMEIASLKQEKAIQELKHRRNNILLIALLFGSLLAAAAIYFVYRNKALKQEKESLKVKQRLLRAQINPHFIFNSLNSIQNLVYNNGSGIRAAKYLSNFSSLMRNTLESSFDEYIGLDEEIEAIKNYLELQKLRFPHKFTYNIKLDENLDPEDLMVPPMLAQPFLENAVLHAFPRVNGAPGDIQIHIRQKNNHIEIQISDNGVGLNGNVRKSENHTSRAVQITKDRLSLIQNKKNANSASIKLIDRKTFGDKGTLVDIKLPLVKAY